jgi:hypothetical protein
VFPKVYSLSSHLLLVEPKSMGAWNSNMLLVQYFRIFHLPKSSAALVWPQKSHLCEITLFSGRKYNSLPRNPLQNQQRCRQAPGCFLCCQVGRSPRPWRCSASRTTPSSWEAAMGQLAAKGGHVLAKIVGIPKSRMDIPWFTAMISIEDDINHTHSES